MNLLGSLWIQRRNYQCLPSTWVREQKEPSFFSEWATRSWIFQTKGVIWFLGLHALLIFFLDLWSVIFSSNLVTWVKTKIMHQLHFWRLRFHKRSTRRASFYFHSGMEGNQWPFRGSSSLSTTNQPQLHALTSWWFLGRGIQEFHK